MRALKSGDRSTRKNRSGFPPTGGFTMIELMVVIGILGVLAGVAVTSLITNLPHMRLKGATNDVVQKFQKARFASVKRHLPVIVTLSGANDNAGSAITIFIDEDRSKTVNGGDTQIDSATIPDKFALAYMVSFNQCATASDPMTVTFNSKGYIEDINGGGKGTMPVVVTLTSQAPTTPANYAVVVERSGIARLISGGYSPTC